MVWTLQTAPELSDRQFWLWSRLLEERTGIQLAPHLRGFLQTQIARRVRELELVDYDQYFETVSTGVTGKIEWSILVDRLVVKESGFFRHSDSIQFVRQQLLQKINGRSLQQSFEVWSLGCATGEEPYSLAMVINDCFEHAGLEPYYGITATDISQSALKQARQGVFSERKVQSIEAKKRSRYFIDIGNREFQVVEKLRERICFSQDNVLQLDKIPDVKMDVIFCQNLLIYFRRWRRREILTRLATRLKPGGVLLIGSGEAMDWSPSGLIRVPNSSVQAYQYTPEIKATQIEKISISEGMP